MNVKNAVRNDSAVYIPYVFKVEGNIFRIPQMDVTKNFNLNGIFRRSVLTHDGREICLGKQ
jgi:hypothetical protein